MMIGTILNDKQNKPKEKTEALSKMLFDKKISMDELIKFASSAEDSPKATCIEAIEYVTKINPAIATLQCLDFVTTSLKEKAPRVKWESAKVIGNIAHLFPGKLDKAIINLILNAEHEGTVVRWSAAFALGEIIKLKTSLNKKLIPTAELICKREEKNSIRKIYLDALKKVMK